MKVILTGFGAIVVVTLLMSAWLAYKVSEVRSDLSESLRLVQDIRYSLKSGDIEGTTIAADKLSQSTSSARRSVHDPVWRIAAEIPVVGPNLSAVRDIAVSTDDISKFVVHPLLGYYATFDFEALVPSGGRIDYKSIAEIAPALLTARSALDVSYDRLANISPDGLTSSVSKPLAEVVEQLASIRDSTSIASSIASLLPPMLGADGARNYLVLVQNNAETRATGGIPGALAVLHTDDGRISLGEQTSAGALGAFRPAIDVDTQQVSLYTARLGTQMQNVNLTPDFPTAAQTAKEMWEQRHPDQTIDGVIALDTVVLSHLLEATGPLDLSDPQVLDAIRNTHLPLSLTKDNVVPTLLSEVYKDIEDPAAQDAYFAAVAGRVFSAFTDGQGESEQLIKALDASTREDRLFLWSSYLAEQEIIATTPVHGSVTGSDSGGAAFGAYFNDGTGAKMDYYVKRSVQLIQACPMGDYGEYTVRVTATNNAPADAAARLPAYVTGNGAFGVEPGRVRTNYVLYGPAQAFVESARVNGETVPVGSGKHGQRPVGTVTQELAPGETAVIDVDFTRVVQDSEPRLQVTPTVQSITDMVLPVIREEACQ